jgi:SWI/SNF-related matrix-associated actin-dependent regulator of chromatin subfamily A-like protein 1
VKLYPYQEQGAEWLTPRSRGLLADPPGLGKTAQALMALPPNAPVVVVCPAVARSVWVGETRAWRPDYRVEALFGRDSFRWPTPGEILAVGYDILPESTPPDRPEGLVCIADEAQYVKSSQAIRTKRWKALSRGARIKWGLSGSPLMRDPLDLYNVLKALDLDLTAFEGGWLDFVKCFRGYKGRFGWKFRTPIDGTGDKLRRALLRRRKEDVLDQLPGKRYQDIEVNIDSAEAMRLADDAAKALGATVENDLILEEVQRSKNIFGLVSQARAALALAKCPALLGWVAYYEEIEEPLVVFSSHRTPIDLLSRRPGWKVITGDTPGPRRGEIVEEFQSGKLKGLGITTAGGVAITLTRAAYMLRVDRDWNPAMNGQIEDRLCRIGQNRSVLIQTLVADHKLDKLVEKSLARKQKMIDGSVEAATV